MADDVATLIYALLKRINARLENVEADIADIKHRLSAMEIVSALNSRMHRFDERLSRIEPRLRLVEQ